MNPSPADEFARVTPILSILIPSVPERGDQLRQQLEKLRVQIEQFEKGLVEVIALVDFRTMSLGEKRNRMMQIGAGTFFLHLDDDDRLVDDALSVLVPILVEDPTIDVVAYDQLAYLDQIPPFRVRTSLEFENETPHQDDKGVWVDIKRKPWHWNTWRAELARQGKFIGRVDEDWQWLKQILPLVKRQYKLDRVLHEYHFNSTASLCLPDDAPKP